MLSTGPSNSSTASSEDSHAVSPVVSRTTSTLPPPPGLGPPPGLAVPTPQKAGVQSASELLSPTSQLPNSDSSEDWGLPMASTVVSAREVDSANIGDLAIGDVKDAEDPEKYWAQQNPWKVDWDKQICPVHKQACKPGICKDMAKLERQKKKEEEAKERANAKRQAGNARRVEKVDSDGWSVAASGGGRGARGGRGGRGESHARGARGGSSERGGRGGTAGRGGRDAWRGSADRGAWGGATSDRGGRGGLATDRGAHGGGKSERGGRGGNAWTGSGESTTSHLQRTTSATRGGRGEWTRGELQL